MYSRCLYRMRICIVAYTHERKEISFEVAPIQYDEAGFDITAPVFGQEYKRPKDTEREKARKALPSPEALRERNAAIPVMGAAHSFIDPKTPFMRQTTGTQIEVAQTVKTHEIIISAVEAAKRYKAALGEVPEGFVNQLREGYPEGVPARVIDNLIHEARGKSDRRNYRDEATVYEGGKKDICADAPEAPAQMHKIA